MEQDEALHVLRITQTSEKRQRVTYQFTGCDKRFTYALDGNVRGAKQALRDLHIALLADPAAVAVLTERENMLGMGRDTDHER